MSCCNETPRPFIGVEMSEPDGDRIEVGRTRHNRKITKKIKRGQPIDEFKKELKARAIPVGKIMSQAEPGEDQPTAPPIKGLASDRATFGIDLGYSPVGRNAVGFSVRKSKMLQAVGQEPTNRGNVVVGETPVPLLAGSWVDKPGYFVLFNESGSGRRTRPTPQEQAILESQIVVIRREGQAAPVGVIRPGSFPFAGEVPSPEECSMVCLNGEASVRVVVVPT